MTARTAPAGRLLVVDVTFTVYPALRPVAGGPGASANAWRDRVATHVEATLLDRLPGGSVISNPQTGTGPVAFTVDFALAADTQVDRLAHVTGLVHTAAARAAADVDGIVRDYSATVR